jgi:diguanylate cyclase (GGDEF)-like protein
MLLPSLAGKTRQEAGPKWGKEAEMHHFLIAEPNETMLRTLSDALNCVDIGIILLNRDMRVRFLNDRLIELFDLPPALLSSGPHFRDLVAFAAVNGRIEMPSDEMDRFIAERVDAVRAGSIPSTRLTLANKVRVLFSCKPCSDGGRILTYAEISQELNREAQHAMENVTADLRFRTEMLEEQGAHLASLAEAADESARKVEIARLELENEIAERRNLEKDLRRLATTDGLTGVLNRSALLVAGQREMNWVRPVGQAVVVLMIDVDHFKRINDRYGHAGGDLALQHLAAMLRLGLREGDLLGRMGGEEFAIVLQSGSAEIAEVIAERLRSQVEVEHVAFGDQIIEMTISIGLAVQQAGDHSIERLMARADAALYHAKRSGRNRVKKDLPSLVV